MSSDTFGRPAVLALLFIGIISGIIPALQGTLLPQLVAEGRLTLGELGQVAMAEAMGTLIAILFATAMLKPDRLKLIVIVASVIGLVLDLVTAKLSGMGIVAARFGHGLCAGVLLWLWVGLLTRIDNPARWIAIYVTAQAATLLGLSSWFAANLLPMTGAMGGFAVLAVLYGVMGVLAFFVPSRFAPLEGTGGTLMPDRIGWIGLFAVFCQLAAILALWVYLKPYGKQIGLSDAETGLAVSIALASQIVAGLLAAAVAGKVSAERVMIVVALASIGALALLLLVPTPFAFTVGATAFAFFWMLVPAFHMPFLIDIDPTRRAAVHMATAQLVGVAAGPALASIAITDGDATGALLIAGALYGLSALIVIATKMGGRVDPPLAADI